VHLDDSEGPQGEALAAAPKSKKGRPQTRTLIADNGVRVYNLPNKDDWTIEPSGDKSFLLLADSNMRHAPTVPAEWEIHCLPGARLRHVAGAISRLQARSSVTVGIQVGINHRGDTTERIDGEIALLEQALNEEPTVRDVIIVGVSTPLSLTPEARDRIGYLNEAMLSSFGQDLCVPPLPEGELRIKPKDVFGIHHQDSSIQAILDTVVAFTKGRSQDFPVVIA
jgi:hypothetical protein